MNRLLQTLARDEMRVPTLRRLYPELCEQSWFVHDAIAAMEQLDAEVAWRAAWLLQRAAREQRLDDNAVARIATAADGLTHWAARLIVCQLLAATGCPASARDAASDFLVAMFDDDRAITRAWALSAMARLTDDPEYAAVYRSMWQRCQSDPSKAMQARLRQLARAKSTTTTANGAVCRSRPRSRSVARST